MDLTQAERDYLFDLQGYLIIDQALSASQLQRIHAWIDRQVELPMGSWIGNIETHTYSGSEGVNYQNIIEGGEVFEELLDCPRWMGDIRRWIENDYNQVTINEAFLNVRGAGGFIGIHSGGHVPAYPMSTRHHAGKWMVGQVNVLMALEDIGPGDGGTVIIPASHKSHLIHPELSDAPVSTYRDDRAAAGALGSIEVHLKAGQAVLFTDGLCHGSAQRTNPGMRKVMIYRYTPHAFVPRYNYLPSPELLARLTPPRRALVQGIPPRMAPGRTLSSASA
jgi:ectoine hydroxylase-related dioxygenase (phytanoyl-CoA dioxygenase family)